MNTEKKWTPETWTFTMCDDGRPMVHTDGDVVCLPDPNHGVDAGLPDEFDVRNFKMISAAPDMAEALLNALAAGLPDVVADAARAALRKAGAL